MAKPTMRNRSIKVPDVLWAAAKAKADANQQNISDVLRAALEDYIKKD